MYLENEPSAQQSRESQEQQRYSQINSPEHLLLIINAPHIRSHLDREPSLVGSPNKKMISETNQMCNNNKTGETYNLSCPMNRNKPKHILDNIHILWSLIIDCI